MWRRLSTQVRKLAPPSARRFAAGRNTFRSSPSPAVPCVRTSAYLFPRHCATLSGEGVVTGKRVEDVMPIATGHEREELEAELQGKKVLKDMDSFVGPFGTKEEPAVIMSYYDKRIVGCSGGEGEDEHDVVWFWLKKGEPHECPVCSQYFVLDVVGPGGPPDGHGDDDEH